MTKPNEFFVQSNIISLDPPHNTLATWCKEPTHWKRPWCWERLKAKREGGDRGWDGEIASLTQWTWIWAHLGKYRRTGKPGMLQSVGSPRVGYGVVTEQQQDNCISWIFKLLFLLCRRGNWGPQILTCPRPPSQHRAGSWCCLSYRQGS